MAPTDMNPNDSHWVDNLTTYNRPVHMVMRGGNIIEWIVNGRVRVFRQERNDFMIAKMWIAEDLRTGECLDPSTDFEYVMARAMLRSCEDLDGSYWFIHGNETTVPCDACGEDVERDEARKDPEGFMCDLCAEDHS